MGTGGRRGATRVTSRTEDGGDAYCRCHEHCEHRPALHRHCFARVTLRTDGRGFVSPSRANWEDRGGVCLDVQPDRTQSTPERLTGFASHGHGLDLQRPVARGDVLSAQHGYDLRGS